MNFLDALKAYQQADEDGVMCLVSRQAVEEAIEYMAPQKKAIDLANKYLREYLDGGNPSVYIPLVAISLERPDSAKESCE